MKTLVLWFTGLSGSGKTTIANLVYEKLNQEGKNVKMLDGDVIRGTVHKSLGFTPEDIKENNRLIAQICKENLGRYDYILVPIISPFRESRNFAKKLLSSQFAELYIKASLDTCIKRDVKGLYKKAMEGSIDNFIGVSPRVPYEEPDSPDIIIDTEREDASTGVVKVLEYINKMEISYGR